MALGVRTIKWQKVKVKCCRPKLERLATSPPTGPTNLEIIIEVMVIMGNDGRTTWIRFERFSIQ